MIRKNFLLIGPNNILDNALMGKDARISELEECKTHCGLAHSHRVSVESTWRSLPASVMLFRRRTPEAGNSL